MRKTTGIPYGAEGAGAPVQRFRDVLKSVTAMEDDHRVYLLLAIEAQSEVHHAMPVRNMVYDALQYAAQVEETARAHRKAKKADDLEEVEKKPDASEYLSGFYREDRLIPVITLVLYFAPGEMSDAEINQFSNSLREVMLFIKYSKDGAKLHEMVQKDDRFKNMDRKAATVISTVTGVEFEMNEEEEKVDMCEGMRGLLDDANKEGMQLGMQNERVAMAKRMLDEGSSSINFIAQMTGLSVDEVQVLATERG
ncbi:MAG: transposase [Lachnospiraceae bacterium]|nr:transposase [Lachnospiraceae bacterium]